MRVLVTGGAGFIGSHLVDALLLAGHEVRVLDNFSTGSRSNLQEHDRLEVVHGDVTDAATVDCCCKSVQAVAHLAAVASVTACMDDPESTHSTNFMATMRLVEAMVSNAIQSITFASTAAIYGTNSDLPLRESEVPDPLSPYAIDKLGSEYFLKYAALRHGLTCTALRFFNVYGPRQDPSSPYSGVISRFVERAKASEAATIYGDGEQSRDFVYVADVVNAIGLALQREQGPFRIYNVGTGQRTSLLELLDVLTQCVGHPIERTFTSPRLGDVLHSQAHVGEIQRDLGWKAVTPLLDGLQNLFQWDSKAIP